jgi:2-polyprenyl-3-methyl-5-hydroxy-6-metoxy-1,4-benzoquinol methylase
LYPIEPEASTAAAYYKEGDFRNLPRSELSLAEHKGSDEIFDTRLGQANRRLQRMLPYINDEMSLLEVGCSAGSFISLAKRHFKNCATIELDSKFANYTRSHQNINVLEKPIEDLPKDAGPFDVICMWHVLEHLADPVSALKNLMDHVKPGGYLFIDVPNVYDPLLTLWQNAAFNDFLPALDQKKLRHIDLRVPMGKSKNPLQYHFKNDGHWNKAGHLLAAEELNKIVSPVWN